MDVDALIHCVARPSAVVLGTSCLGYELSCVRVVLGTSCRGYELS